MGDVSYGKAYDATAGTMLLLAAASMEVLSELSMKPT